MNAPSPASSAPSLLAAARVLALLSLLAAAAPAQTWKTAWTEPGDKFVQLDYAVVFVANRGHADQDTETPPHFGLDVLSANNVAPHGPGGGMYVLLPVTGQVVKLFPLAAHESVPGLIDTPLGALHNGAVAEPNISEDGRTVYFTYFHDQEWKLNGGGWQELKLSYKGADLYRMDIGPLLDDETTNPATLPVKRLTHKVYTGSAKGNVQQTTADRYRHAMNPGLADAPSQGYQGTVDMHLIEMRTATGLKAVWVSDRARLGNSNGPMVDSNHNFNIYIADFLQDGSLGHARQWQYYTTTSALSPTPMRDGISFSYQSSTEGGRRWDIQTLSSVGQWAPLIGYAHHSELFHLGSFCVAPGPGGGMRDYFIGTKYYNLNDGGLGQLHLLDMEDQGLNQFVPGDWAKTPAQYNTLLTVGAAAKDMPSPQVLVDGKLEYIGKFSCPRVGRIGGEYLMSYTPTSANRWLFDADGKKGVFDVHITYRPSLQPFKPHDPVDPAAGKGLFTVVDDSSGVYSLLWPTPTLSWMERYGTPQQEFQISVIDPETDIPRGLPFAQVGTSAIWNTDIRPFDCYIGNSGTKPYNPNTTNANEDIALDESLEGLRYVQDQGDFCEYLLPETVLGIGINITSNRTDVESTVNVFQAFTTDKGGQKEAVEMLGVYSILEQNLADQSFLARIPASTPFEFHLLDRRYGMKLADVRSWHSLQPRESRTDCGGCHQHEAGFAIPFAGTEASQKPALDMTVGTRYVGYDEDCKPVIRHTSLPTVEVPEWKADIWPGFAHHCSSCHDSNVSASPSALAALSYTGESTAYNVMKERNWASNTLGALGSPAFWAAYGERTDGRNNALPQYQPDYPAGKWGYRFSAIHAVQPGLCAQSNPAWAEWVRRFGQWIDNHMPRDTGQSPLGYHHDRFHPAVDFAITELGKLRFGYWDNSGSVSLQFELNDVRVLALGNLSNGKIEIALPTIQATDRIKIIAIDGAGNRQITEKSFLQLLQDFVLDPS